MVASLAERRHRPGCMHWSEEGEGQVGTREEHEKRGRIKKSWEMEGRENTEVCKLVVHRRRQIGSGSQVVRLSDLKANTLHSYYCHLPFAYCTGQPNSKPLYWRRKEERAHKGLQVTNKPHLEVQAEGSPTLRGTG